MCLGCPIPLYYLMLMDDESERDGATEPSHHLYKALIDIDVQLYIYVHTNIKVIEIIWLLTFGSSYINKEYDLRFELLFYL